MCCPLDQVNGRLFIQALDFEEERDNEKICHIRGIYDRTPATLADRVFRFFQHIELIEKIAEIGDELFHLLGTVFQRYTSVLVYQTLRNLHHAAHDVEHVLHTFCFLGDLTRLMTNQFFEYHDEERTQFDYVRSAARVCHITGHFLATASFLSELQLYQFKVLEKYFKYAPAFTALGYAIWTLSLIWRRHQEEADDHFSSDLGIHLAGCLFEAIPLTKSISTLAPYAHVINKVTAIAGIIHAWCVVQRLMPQDQEELEGDFVMPADDVFAHSPHKHGHQHRNHAHKPCFHAVKV